MPPPARLESSKTLQEDTFNIARHDIIGVRGATGVLLFDKFVEQFATGRIVLDDCVYETVDLSTT
jgi:hypothetical protein